MGAPTAATFVRNAGRGVVRAAAMATADLRVLPDLVIVGVKRGGTTSLFRDLERHRSMCPLVPSARILPLRENMKGVHYFDGDLGQSERWYRSHFPTTLTTRRRAKRTGGSFTAEASPYYFFHPLGPSRAAATLPDTTFVVMLRDPVERTVSHWAEQTRNGVETLSLADALEAESARVGDDAAVLADGSITESDAHEQQTYAGQSDYVSSFDRWVSVVGRERLVVVFSEDYYRDPVATVAMITDRLGIAPMPSDGDVVHRNAAPRPSTLDPEIDSMLTERFRPSVDALRDRLGNDDSLAAFRALMRILQLHARYRVRAGEDSVVDSEAEALERAGHDVRRFIVDNPTTPTASVRALAGSVYNRSVARRVRNEIAAFEPDVVHVHNTWFALSSSAVSAAAGSGRPVVMTLHNFRVGCLSTDLFRDGTTCTACVGRAPLPGVVHGCYRGSRMLSAVQATEIIATRTRCALTKSVTRFVAPSQFMADRLDDMGVPMERLIVKPHFVDDPGPRTLPPSESDTVLTIGRLAPGKGIDALLAGWRQVDLSGPCKRLVVVGDGPLADELGAMAPASVDMAGWCDRESVRQQLLTARALVMPSELYETFGMVLVEAMSAALPIIVTDVAGAAQLVDVPDDLVVAPRDPAAIAVAIGRLDHATTDRVGAANRARYERCFSVDVGVANLEALYAEAIEASATRDV